MKIHETFCLIPGTHYSNAQQSALLSRVTHWSLLSLRRFFGLVVTPEKEQKQQQQKKH